MAMLEIHLNNPIGTEEVDDAIKMIIEYKKKGCLMVDFGNHEFQSIEIIKYCKEALSAIKDQLLLFQKIAFIHPPYYSNQSENVDKMQFFTSIEDAKAWIAEV